MAASSLVCRPSEVCRALLAALDASEGRRRNRKRDQTADAFGLSVKRDLLQLVVDEDPPPDAFEEWLFNYPARCERAELAGPALAMARIVFEEWRLTHTLRDFKRWLEEGAPSEDAFRVASVGGCVGGARDISRRTDHGRPD